MLLAIVLGVYAALFGLIIGSYLNVVIYRLPRGLSTVLPRSRCPSCGAPILARDNLPVVSYLLLGGRCRTCRAEISWRYPAIEALTAVVFVGSMLRFGPSLEAAAGALFGALMIALGAIDAEHMILPDRLTLPAIVVGIALQPWLGEEWGGVGVGGALLGAALGGGILLALWAVWYALRREEGMGLGDVKMLAAIGAFLGWKGMVFALFVGSVTGAVTGVMLMRRQGLGMKAKLPFGTFLALGGLLALFAGQPLVDAYLGLL